MSYITADRILETSMTLGTGNITLAGTSIGYRTFASVAADTDTFDYVIEGVDPATGLLSGEWEVGLGAYSAPSVLVRTTVYASSAAGAKVNFSSGPKRVYTSLAAKRLLGVSVNDLMTVGQTPLSASSAAALRALTVLISSANYDGSTWLLKTISALSAAQQAAVTADTANGMYAISSVNALYCWERQSKVVYATFFKNAGTDGQVLQKFFDFAALLPTLSYDWTGVYSLAASVTYGGVSPASRIKDISMRGCINIACTAAMKNPLNLANIERGTVGDIVITGVGGSAYNTRTVGHGVIQTAVTYVTFGSITGFYLKGSVLFDDGAGVVNDANTYGHIMSYSCGSGSAAGNDASYSLTANYSARVDAGGGSPTQTTTYTMSALPGTEWDFTVARTIPLYVSFDFDYNEMYQIQSFSRGAGTITISPQPPAAALTGAARYRLGGAVTTSGVDANINTYQHVSCSTSGIGFNVGALYGSTCLQLDLNSVAIGLAIGQSNNAACLDVNFPAIYCEANCLTNIVKGTLVSAPQFTGEIHLAVGDLSKVKTLGYYRSLGVTYRRYVSMGGMVLKYLGRVLTEQLWPNNEADSFGQYANVNFLDLKNGFAPQIFRDTSGLNTPYITVLTPDPGLNDNFGYDSALVIAMGAPGSARLAPAGVVFQPPTGWKINGGVVNTNATFANFAGVAIIAVRYDFAALNLIISTVTAPKDTGWTAMTNTTNKATAYDTTTVTLPQLASRVKALQDVLNAAGIVAP